MSKVGSAIANYVLTKTAVSTLISDRIYNTTLPQDDDDSLLPAVTYETISTTRSHILEGVSGVAKTRLQLEAISLDGDEASDVAETIAHCGVVGIRGTYSGVEILGVQLDDGPYDGIDIRPANGSQEPRFKSHFDLIVFYKEPI